MPTKLDLLRLVKRREEGRNEARIPSSTHRRRGCRHPGRGSDRPRPSKQGTFPGLWTFPGGAVELGEPIQDAARREALEETGLEIQIGEVLCVVDRIDRDESGRVRYHYLIVDYEARPVGGRLCAGDDASEVRWVGFDDLGSLDITEKAREIAHDLLEASEK